MQHDDDTLPPMPHEDALANEEGHYWSTLKDFQELVRLRGIGTIFNDLDDTTIEIIEEYLS